MESIRWGCINFMQTSDLLVNLTPRKYTRLSVIVISKLCFNSASEVFHQLGSGRDRQYHPKTLINIAIATKHIFITLDWGNQVS